MRSLFLWAEGDVAVLRKLICEHSEFNAVNVVRDKWGEPRPVNRDSDLWKMMGELPNEQYTNCSQSECQIALNNCGIVGAWGSYIPEGSNPTQEGNNLVFFQRV